MAMPSLTHQLLHFLSIYHSFHVLKQSPIQHFFFFFQRFCYFKFMVFEEKQFTPKVEIRVKAHLHDLLPDCV